MKLRVKVYVYKYESVLADLRKTETIVKLRHSFTGILTLEHLKSRTYHVSDGVRTNLS